MRPARFAAALVLAVDSRPTPAISVQSRGTCARAVSIYGVRLGIVQEGRLAVRSSTTIAARRVAIQREILPARLL